eukprot:m.151928 g.151928  ORF g.151928 m.151928 type:complete len:163 (-) comp23370_c0_seq1:1727-2215(-)
MWTIAVQVAVLAAANTETTRHNILLIVVDDLRPQIGAYGEKYMHTPHMDKLASEGAIFTQAYVQQSICGPTRNSFLSGRYPDKTKSWNFLDSFREPGVGDKWTALPQFFKENGYFTLGAGKIFVRNSIPTSCTCARRQLETDRVFLRTCWVQPAPESATKQR